MVVLPKQPWLAALYLVKVNVKPTGAYKRLLLVAQNSILGPIQRIPNRLISFKLKTKVPAYCSVRIAPSEIVGSR